MVTRALGNFEKVEHIPLIAEPQCTISEIPTDNDLIVMIHSDGICVQDNKYYLQFISQLSSEDRQYIAPVLVQYNAEVMPDDIALSVVTKEALQALPGNTGYFVFVNDGHGSSGQFMAKTVNEYFKNDFIQAYKQLLAPKQEEAAAPAVHKCSP